MNRLTDRSKEIQLPCTGNGVFWARVHEKLARYEDSGLEPEEMRELLYDSTGPLHKKLGEWIDAEQEGRLVVFPRGDDATPIKCTGLKCPMQAGKVDPAMCKAADSCKWATKPLTNADRIRTMTDKELAEHLFDVANYACPPGKEFTTVFCGKYPDCKKCWRAWLKQEVKE